MRIFLGLSGFEIEASEVEVVTEMFALAAIVAAATMLRERFPVMRMCLFGSKATRRDDAESDIDRFVLTSRPLSWRERDAVAA